MGHLMFGLNLGAISTKIDILAIFHSLRMAKKNPLTHSL
jgi:hypothetical protein